MNSEKKNYNFVIMQNLKDMLGKMTASASTNMQWKWMVTYPFMSHKRKKSVNVHFGVINPFNLTEHT